MKGNDRYESNEVVINSLDLGGTSALLPKGARGESGEWRSDAFD